MLRVGVLAITATLLVPAAVRAAPTGAWQMRQLSRLQTAVHAKLNGVRVESGLAPLRASPSLRRAAVQHVYEMGVLGYFGHESPNRASFAARLSAYYTPRGYATWHVGETLLWWPTWLSARAIVRLWLNSPEHRRQLLDPRFREIGIDAAEVHGAGGVFRGRRVMLVGADFGVRR